MLDIVNYYERLVSVQLWKIIEEKTFGELPISLVFLEDVACLALNNLPACYVRSPVDKMATLDDLKAQEMCEAVNRAIAEAIEKVQRHPHDDREV